LHSIITFIKFTLIRRKSKFWNAFC